MRHLSTFLASVLALCVLAVPTADALMWSSFTAATSKYDVRAAIKAKRSSQKSRPASVELPAMAKGGLVFGDNEATTTIVMFTDIECPFCKRFHKDTYPTLKKDYIDTGKVRFVIKHFPLVFHPYADHASRAVVCARAQGDDKARSLYEALIKIEDFATGTIKTAAKKSDLDTDTLQTCMEAWSSRETVDADATLGVDANVRGTPSFFITGPNGKVTTVTGAFPLETFVKAIAEVQGAKK